MQRIPRRSAVFLLGLLFIIFVLYRSLSIIRHKNHQLQSLQKRIELASMRKRLVALAIYEEGLNITVNELGAAANDFLRLALPTSSDVHCFGQCSVERTCRFRNICYDTLESRFFILQQESQSIFQGAPGAPEEVVVDLSSVHDHNTFYFKYDRVASSFFHQRKYHGVRFANDHPYSPASLDTSGKPYGPAEGHILYVKEQSYITRRFFPHNIMHMIHDDWLGLFAQHQLYSYANHSSQWPDHTRMLVYDDYGVQPYDSFYPLLGKYEMMDGFLRRHGNPHYVCWRDAVVGNSKEMTWYQYGYGIPQGPLPNSNATGIRLREAASHVLGQLGLPKWEKKRQFSLLEQLMQRKMLIDSGKPAGDQSEAARNSHIAIFSRKKNRLILNEDTLVQTLAAQFGLPVRILRLEEQSISAIISVLRTTTIAIGMHGSLLVMAMFLPPGAVLIEAYPYGVPSQNYTPYKTLCGLPKMYIAYRAWENKNQTASISYPDRPKGEGGIRHLDQAQQAAIESSETIPAHTCCDNPHWLYRIFQDTRVDEGQLIELIWEAVKESWSSFPQSWK